MYMYGIHLSLWMCWFYSYGYYYNIRWNWREVIFCLAFTCGWGVLSDCDQMHDTNTMDIVPIFITERMEIYAWLPWPQQIQFYYCSVISVAMMVVFTYLCMVCHTKVLYIISWNCQLVMANPAGIITLQIARWIHYKTSVFISAFVPCHT